MNKLIIGILVIVAIVVSLGIFLIFGSSSTTGSSVIPTVGVKEFTIIAKNWEFDPATITVNQGDTVKLHVKSIDVAHGFRLSSFNINERLEPGKTADIEFVADKTGTFTFACSVFCGSGHSRMVGQLIVK